VAWCASTNCKNANSSPVRSKATRWSSSDTGGVAPTAPVEGLTPPTIQLNRAVNYYKANKDAIAIWDTRLRLGEEVVELRDSVQVPVQPPDTSNFQGFV